jgi:DNA polymerase III subunit delta'
VFRTIVGHRRVLSLLSRAISNDTLPPTLLFSGPAGVGKRRTADALSRAINCLTPVTDATVPPVHEGDAPLALARDACGTCAACRRIERSVHPDVIVVEPGETGAIKIEPVRDVIDRAAFRPFEARRRVVILDEADAMQAAAQSALLKTLEEPPSASIFLLLSSLPDALLPTVRSRCPRIRFAPLTSPEVAYALVRDHEYTREDASAVAIDADGSVGRALAAQAADLIDARESARRLLEHSARVSDPVRRIEAVKDFIGSKPAGAAERDKLSACLRVLASLLRDVGVLVEGGDPRVLANPDSRRELDAIARTFDSQRTTRAYQAVDEALLAVDRNVSPKVVIDWLALQL